jgi:hypothetical protein
MTIRNGGPVINFPMIRTAPARAFAYTLRRAMFPPDLRSPLSPADFARALTRRQLFGRTATGLGAAALASLLGPSSTLAAETVLGQPHFAPKAKRVIHLFMHGGPSQVDLFDHKPGLRARHGQELPESVRGTRRLTGMTSSQK